VVGGAHTHSRSDGGAGQPTPPLAAIRTVDENLRPIPPTASDLCLRHNNNSLRVVVRRSPFTVRRSLNRSPFVKVLKKEDTLHRREHVKPTRKAAVIQYDNAWCILPHFVSVSSVAVVHQFAERLKIS